MSGAPAGGAAPDGADGPSAPRAAHTLRVACVQLNTAGDKTANLAAAERLVRAAAADGARLIALPETWAYKGRRAGILASAEPVDGPSNAVLAGLAAELGVHVLAGSHYEPSPVPDRVANTSALFGPGGETVATYHKIHLFDAVSGGTPYRESSYLVPGADVVTAAIEPHGANVTVGLAICYDLRFPELFRSLALRGAEILLVPSAFTHYTGAAHWEVLVRARAVENGCFVVAPNQTGYHLPEHRCFGHSMIVDPWGTVLARMEEEVGSCAADLDLARVAAVRSQIPSLANRRPETYGL